MQLRLVIPCLHSHCGLHCNSCMLQLDDLISSCSIKEAAKYAAESPDGVLRTAETIRKFQGLAAPEGGASPILQYFQTLLEVGKLNALETTELARPLVAKVT